MNTTMNAMNATLATILNTTISAKRKNDEGKYEQYTTTMLEDGFKRIPKASDITDEKAKAAFNNLFNVFKYMEEAGVASTDNQRDKAVNKAYDFARAYLKAVGMSAGIGNVSLLTAVFAPKKQTTKGAVKGGYTTKSTFVKYALYMSYHFATKKAWCDPKSTKKPNETEALWAQLEQNKKEFEAQKANVELAMSIISENPELLKKFNEAKVEVA